MMNSTEKDEEMPELELIEKRVMPLLPKTGIVVASVSIKKPNRKRPVQVPVEKPEEIILDKGPLSDNFKVICPCKIEQRINYPPTALCRGAEFIDGEIKICAEKATGKKAFRSSHLVTFFIPLCQECTLEMHSHYFCPACGFKCKNSNFIECEDGHRFHKLCAELLPDADSKCPHCEKEISERSKRPVFKIEPKIAKRDFNINLPRRIGTIQNNFKFNDEENGFLCEMVNALYKSVTGLKNVTKQKISAAEVSRAIDKNDFQNLAKFIVTGCLNTRIEGLTLFHYAIRKNKFYLAEVFQRLGVDPSLGHIETNRNALMEAIEKNALKTVQFCILSKTDSSIKDMTGKSALHYAAKTACREIVELLLENSARIIIGDQDYTGFSALHWAIEGASLEILILILRFSSPEDLIKCDQQSKTALHWAAHYGKARFCEKLLEFDSKLIDIQDSEGKTAMHYAAMANSEATIISLAKFTPDLSKKDKTAKFARDYTKCHIT